MKSRLLIAVALFLFFSGPVAAQTKLVEKVTKKGDELVIPYEKYVLSNGLTLIIHEDPDNFGNIPPRYTLNGAPGPDQETLATGDSGKRVACGVIAPASTASTSTSTSTVTTTAGPSPTTGATSTVPSPAPGTTNTATVTVPTVTISPPEAPNAPTVPNAPNVPNAPGIPGPGGPPGPGG